MDLRSSLEDAIHAYQELNSPLVDELDVEPSALEFMRYVANNRPFVVRGALLHWKASHLWRAQYLHQKLSDCKIQVAATPDGMADAARRTDTDRTWFFAKPCERSMSFSSFLEYIQRPPSEILDNDEVWYAQTQNDNLRGEYVHLFSDVERDIRWATIALGNKPDAINLWIGTSKSTTAMHRDPYQNIYCQIVGQKHFVLVPPIEAPCVNEQFLPPATWSEGPEPVLRPDADDTTVPCALWDPDHPEHNQSPLSSLCRPMRVTLRPGDMFFLPAMWHHKVSQTEGDERFACSVNYWYDMEYSGSFWPFDQLVRAQARSLARPPR